MTVWALEVLAGDPFHEMWLVFALYTSKAQAEKALAFGLAAGGDPTEFRITMWEVFT